jgi:hypothetical protein
MFCSYAVCVREGLEFRLLDVVRIVTRKPDDDEARAVIAEALADGSPAEFALLRGEPKGETGLTIITAKENDPGLWKEARELLRVSAARGKVRPGRFEKGEP